MLKRHLSFQWHAWDQCSLVLPSWTDSSIPGATRAGVLPPKRHQVRQQTSKARGLPLTSLRLPCYTSLWTYTPAYLGLTLDVLQHGHWIWTGHGMGNYGRAKDFRQIGNIHLSARALSHSKQKSIMLEDLFYHLNRPKYKFYKKIIPPSHSLLNSQPTLPSPWEIPWLLGTSFCCTHLCKWIMRKANVSLLAWGSSPTAWYMAAMLLSSSVISVNEKKAPRGLRLPSLDSGLRSYRPQVSSIQ